MRIQERLEYMYARRKDYHYSLLGALACFFRLPLVRKHHYFCSQFVAETLAESGAVRLGWVPAVTPPADFLTHERLRKIQQGVIGAQGLFVAMLMSVLIGDLEGAAAWVA